MVYLTDDQEMDKLVNFAAENGWEVTERSDEKLNLSEIDGDFQIRISKPNSWKVMFTDDAFVADRRALDRMVVSNSSLTSALRISKGMIAVPETIIEW